MNRLTRRRDYHSVRVEKLPSHGTDTEPYSDLSIGRRPCNALMRCAARCSMATSGV